MPCRLQPVRQTCKALYGLIYDSICQAKLAADDACGSAVLLIMRSLQSWIVQMFCRTGLIQSHYLGGLMFLCDKHVKHIA